MPDDVLNDFRWYRDAVIYELHVRSFYDANDDGYGDFHCLREKLPYVDALGVHTLWLLPFLESPLKDDGPQTGLRMAELGPTDRELPVLSVEQGLQNVLIPTLAGRHGPEQLGSILPEFLRKQRWFGAKGDRIRDVAVEDAVRLREDPTVYLSILEVTLEDQTAFYTLPLMTASEGEAGPILEEAPVAAIGWLSVAGMEEHRLVYDATVNPQFWVVLFRWWQEGSQNRSLNGTYTAQPLSEVKGDEPDDIELLTREQSNTSAIVNDDYFVKIYRRIETGPHPEEELLNHLGDVDFPFAPRLHGTITRQQRGRQYTLGVLQEAFPVETDGWTYARTCTTRFLDRVADTSFPHGPASSGDAPDPENTPAESPSSDPSAPGWLEEVAPELISLAQVLGVRTAELHRALAKAQGDGLRPVRAPSDAGSELARRLLDEMDVTRAVLDDQPDIDRTACPSAADWQLASDRIDALQPLSEPEQNIRLHGDYHLGQLIWADGDVYILDFEGEPARSLSERRNRENALRDVAGMMRSFEYAVLAGWKHHTSSPSDTDRWVHALLHWLERTFFNAYEDTAEDAPFFPPTPDCYSFLWGYLFRKALYEVRYEVNHRPDWVWIPLRGVRRLLQEDDCPPVGRRCV